MNMRIWDAVSQTPPNCTKRIPAGRLRGMTDISPTWRVETLTRMFGPCGLGWKIEVVRSEIVPGAGDEARAFIQLNLYIRDGDHWSEAIPGFGGSSYTTKEKNGVYTDDECYKKAFTDALGSACRLLGFSADIYSSAYGSKYEDRQTELRLQFEPFVGLTPAEAYKKDPRRCYEILSDPNAPDWLKNALRAAAGGSS